MLSIAIPTYFLVLCTAYSPSIEECGKTDGITASGIRAIEGKTIAADDLPLGTKVEIDGIVYTVHDRFGAGHKNRIDIFKESKNDCLEFGRQYAFAKIISKPINEIDFSFNPFPDFLREDYFF